MTLVTSQPRTDSRVLCNSRKYKPTQPPSEELKFALLNNAKTQKYVPVRQTPAYEVTTPTYSVTPPALEFEPTPAELKLKGKDSKTYSNPQHGRFKISVDNGDVNNFQPTPPPSTLSSHPPMFPRRVSINLTLPGSPSLARRPSHVKQTLKR